MEAQDVFLSASETRAFHEIVEPLGWVEPPSHGFSPTLRRRWCMVADTRDCDLVKTAVLDLHVREATELDRVLDAGQKLALLTAYSKAFIIYLMAKLPPDRRQHLPRALQNRGQYKVQVQAAQAYHKELMDRARAGGSAEPQWEDLMEAVVFLAEMWDLVDAQLGRL